MHRVLLAWLGSYNMSVVIMKIVMAVEGLGLGVAWLMINDMGVCFSCFLN